MPGCLSNYHNQVFTKRPLGLFLNLSVLHPEEQCDEGLRGELLCIQDTNELKCFPTVSLHAGGVLPHCRNLAIYFR